MEEKQRYSNKGKGFSEGYGHDRLDTAAHNADCNDRLILYVEPEDQRKLEFWPDNPVSLRKTAHKYSAMAKMVVQQILREMARSLELEETHFIQQFGEKMTTSCRFSHYPSCLRPGLVFGCRPHSDNSVLTVILPSGDVEGLELLKGDVWVRVPYNPDVLLVLMGDLAEIMSNGLFKSPLHRVVAHPEKERTSTALFYAADPEREIGPAEKLIQDGMPRLYRDFRVQDYLDVHLRSYSQGKSSIDWAKAS